MRTLLLSAAAALMLTGCADEQARDQASAAEERADAAHTLAEEQRIRTDELEDRLNQAGK